MPVGREWPSARGRGRVWVWISQDRVRPALRQPTLCRRTVVAGSSCCLLCTSEPVAFLTHRGGGVTYWHVGLFSFVRWKFYCGVCFCFSLPSPRPQPSPPPRSVLHALWSDVGSEMAGTEKGWRSICVSSFSERDCSELPSFLVVLFELCRALFSQAEPPDRSHSWPVTSSNLAFCMWDDHGFFCLSRYMQMRASALSQEQEMQRYMCEMKVVTWVHPPPLKIF
jgi:hypothetical protein